MTATVRLKISHFTGIVSYQFLVPQILDSAYSTPSPLYLVTYMLDKYSIIVDIKTTSPVFAKIRGKLEFAGHRFDLSMFWTVI